MNWFMCDVCGKLSRSNKKDIICICGNLIESFERDERLMFIESRISEIPPNPNGRLYKDNKSFRMVEE